MGRTLDFNIIDKQYYDKYNGFVTIYLNKCKQWEEAKFMVVLRKAVALTTVDTFIGSAYRSGTRNHYACGCTCY